jgi:predicted PurR-regulated permease PerM
MDPGASKLNEGSRPAESPSSGDAATASAGVVTPSAQVKQELQLHERGFSYWALLVLTAAALYLAYIIYRPFLKVFFLALVLTIAFWPLDRWIAQRVRSDTARALLTTASVVFAIMLPLFFVSINLVSEAAGLYGLVKTPGNWSGHFAWLTEAVKRIAERSGIPAAQINSVITARVQGLGAGLVGIVGWAARGFGQQVGTAILTLLIMFFFLRDMEKYTHGVAQILPLPPPRMKQLAETLRTTVVSNVYGMVAVGLIQGALLATGWWMTGLRSPLLWGAIATLFSFVPLVGPSLVWWPGVFVLAMQGRWIQAAILLVWGLIVVSSADYIVRPKFAGGRTNANTLLVLLSLIGGLKAFGAVGIIAGPVVLSVVAALVSMVREERQD